MVWSTKSKFLSLSLFMLSFVYGLMMASDAAFCSESPKRPIKDLRGIKLPSKTDLNTTAPEQQTAPAFPQVESVEILPPSEDCSTKWRVTLKNKGMTPFDKPIMIRPSQKKGSTNYKGLDVLVAPNPIPVDGIGSAMGTVIMPEKYTHYSFEIVIEDQTVSTQTGAYPPKPNHDIAIGDVRFEGNKFYVTFINNSIHRSCGLLFMSFAATSTAPETWISLLNFGKDIPPNGSVDQSFVLPPGYASVKAQVRVGATVLAEKVVAIP